MYLYTKNLSTEICDKHDPFVRFFSKPLTLDTCPHIWNVIFFSLDFCQFATPKKNLRSPPTPHLNGYPFPGSIVLAVSTVHGSFSGLKVGVACVPIVHFMLPDTCFINMNFGQVLSGGKRYRKPQKICIWVRGSEKELRCQKQFLSNFA